MIGITFVNMMRSMLGDDDEEIISSVRGEDDELISFKGYEHVKIVEQDNPE